MKIGFFDPYFDALGGGERYILTLASHWAVSHTVDLFWDDPTVKEKNESHFGIDLSRTHVVKNIFRMGHSVRKLYATRGYDLIFFMTDGSVPVTLARHNILHIQVPLVHMRLPAWKAWLFDAIVCNSEFTKSHIDMSIAKRSEIIYPPVDIDAFAPRKKTKTILSVGRFNALYQAKKQEILVEAFSEGIRSGVLKGYTLILAGSMQTSDTEYVKSLERKAKGLPVRFSVDCPFPELQRMYGEAMIYWHAAGFGESDPSHMEHFGISTVEAMKSGCVPIVYDGGGQREIVIDGENGYTFSTIAELLKKTDCVIQDPKLLNDVSDRAQSASLAYSTQKFCDHFDQLLTRICI